MYCVSTGYYEISTGVTDALLTNSLTHSQTLKDRATQLHMVYKSGALIMQYLISQKLKYKAHVLIVSSRGCTCQVEAW